MSEDERSGASERDSPGEADEREAGRETGGRDGVGNESDERGGFGEGAAQSTGDPRVVTALNAVLSTAFATFVAWGLSILGVADFTLVNVATLAVLLFAVTYVVTKPDSPA